MAPPRPAARGLSFEALTASLLLLGTFVLGCLMPVQNDTWWHLRTGQEIVRLGHVPLEELLSHTAVGRAWPNHEWLAQVIFYGAHRLGGMPLLAALGACLVTSAMALAASLVPPHRRVLCLLLALPVVASGFAVRPHLFTLLLLPLTVRLIMRGALRWLPLVFVAWANLHSGVLVAGPALVAVGLVALTQHRERLRGTLAISAAWLLGTLATPLGPRLWTFARENLASPVARVISEWQPATWTNPWDLLFGAQVLLLAALAWRGWRDPGADFSRRTLVLSALFVATLGFRAVRHQSLAALLIAPALAAHIPTRRRAEQGTSVEASSAAKPAADHPTANARILALAAALAVGAVAWAWSRPLPRLGWRPMSPAAAAAIAACPDPLYNGYDDGGVLLWFVPGKRVFLDSRHDPYPHELMLAQRQVELTGAYQALFNRFGIACAVVAPHGLTARRLDETAWRRSYADERWAVYTR